MDQGSKVEKSGFHSKQAVVHNPKNLKRQVRTHMNQGPEVERSGFHSKQAVVYNPKNLKRQVRTHMNQGPEVEKSGFHSKQAVVYNPKNLKKQVRTLNTHMKKFLCWHQSNTPPELGRAGLDCGAVIP